MAPVKLTMNNWKQLKGLSNSFLFQTRNKIYLPMLFANYSNQIENLTIET